jgi:hypothetical protein
MSRVKSIAASLIGTEDPDDLMLEILDALSETSIVPDVGNFYTFVYKPKTLNTRYDAHPLVAVTDLFKWGFKGINFHWGQSRNYTWEEIIGSLHLVYKSELKDLQMIPYQRIRINN